MTFNPQLPHITPNFTLAEFQCQGMYCCGHTAAINYEVVKRLQKIRDIIAQKIVVTSGFRCRTHNQEVGGRVNSAHIYGLAVDIATPKSIDSHDFENICLTAGFTFILLYGWGFHLDIMER
jgi:hypothetical protein